MAHPYTSYVPPVWLPSIKQAPHLPTQPTTYLMRVIEAGAYRAYLALVGERVGRLRHGQRHVVLEHDAEAVQPAEQRLPVLRVFSRIHPWRALCCSVSVGPGQARTGRQAHQGGEALYVFQGRNIEGSRHFFAVLLYYMELQRMVCV